MTIFYLDSSLSGNLGHHANSARVIVPELCRYGDVKVYGNQEMPAELQEELGTSIDGFLCHAVPHFHYSAYWTNTGDNICGWLSAFLTSANQFERDLHELSVRGGDVLYINSGQAAQLQGLVQFLSVRDVQAVIEFGVDPGLQISGQQAMVRNPLEDARSVLYRFVASQMQARVLSRLWMATFDSKSSEVYSRLMGRPVHTLPVPRSAVGALRCRRPDFPITVGFLGHQRGEKGYQFVPEIISEVLRRAPEKVKFLVHNGDPEFMHETQKELRSMNDSRIVLDERLADDEIWADLLERCDLIVLPYNPERFSVSYSAVACEALANGIPMVVPADTTMSRMLYMAGGGVRFGYWRPDSIAEAIDCAVNYFGLLAERAAAGATWWAENHGAKRMVDGMMTLLGIGEACHEEITG